MPAGPDWGDLSSALGLLLRLAQIEAQERFEAGEASGLRLAEVSVLRLVGANPGIRQGALGRALRIKRAHMTKMARALGDRGLIAAVIPQGDRRAVEQSLTAAGQAEMQRLWPQVMAREARVPQGLTADEAAQLARLLRKYLNIPERREAPL